MQVLGSERKWEVERATALHFSFSDPAFLQKEQHCDKFTYPIVDFVDAAETHGNGRSGAADVNDLERWR
jgi:hypothetical protein